MPNDNFRRPRRLPRRLEERPKAEEPKADALNLIQFPPAKGWCYFNAFVHAVANVASPANWVLAHGIITGTGEIEGVEHGHAWLEGRFASHDLVWDPSYGMMAKREDYYEKARVKYVKRYTFDEMMRLTREEGCRPWDPIVDAAEHNP